jgi:hypothetical protein
MAAPLGGADGDPRAPTTYVGDIDGGPLGGVGAGDLGAPMISARKRRRWALWEVPELEV